MDLKNLDQFDNPQQGNQEEILIVEFRIPTIAQNAIRMLDKIKSQS